jgi:sulfur relay (sulfurtransferase) complex TusBCD TusD component (DsrE family)
VKKRLGILIATAPQEGDWPLIEAVARAALSEGREVGLFLMDSGVAYAVDARLRSLLDHGVQCTLCAMDAEAQGLSPEAIVAVGVQLGSQHDHARLVRDSDQLLSFT